METSLSTIRSSDGTPWMASSTREVPADPAGAANRRQLRPRSEMNFYVGLPRFAAADLVGSGYDVVR